MKFPFGAQFQKHRPTYVPTMSFSYDLALTLGPTCKPQKGNDSFDFVKH